ncbi:MAG: phosphate ABC transporter permease subunit PstC [Deltaproteobacteria bacterium]|nr:phosphate ABC transporter permease subunit PstC [Deltaproteobacteria bacterium]
MENDASSLSRVERPLSERVIEALLRLAAMVSVATTAAIVLTLGLESAAFFSEVSPGAFLLDTEWTPLFAQQHFGIWPLVCGTVLTSFIAMTVAVPFGLLAAIQMSEFSSPRVRFWLKPSVEVLAGVPTVVYGYVALIFVTPVLQKMMPSIGAFNALAPGLVMGLMIMPTIASLSEDAIRAVPVSLREASLGLGVGRVSTIVRVVLPSAFSGIAASVILGVSRAVGETMIVAIAAGQQPRLTLDPTVPIATMTAFIVQVSMGDTPHGTLEYKSIYVVGAALFLITFGMNWVSYRLSRRYRRLA